MAKKLNEFFSLLTQEGVRLSHQYQVSIPNVPGLENISMWAQNASVPSLTINPIDVSFLGFQFSVPGGFTMGNELPMTIRSDMNNRVREAFLNWANTKANIDIASGGSGGGEKRIPTEDVYLDLLDQDMTTVITTYVLVGAYPTSIGEIAVSHDEPSAVTFDVTIRYEYWRVEGRQSGPFQR